MYVEGLEELELVDDASIVLFLSIDNKPCHKVSNLRKVQTHVRNLISEIRRIIWRTI